MITIKITNKIQIENVRIRNFCARPHFCVCSVLCSNDHIRPTWKKDEKKTEEETYDVGDLTNEEQPVAIEERNEGPDEGDMTFTEQITDDGLRVVNPTGNVPYPQPPSDEELSQQPQSHTVTSEELNEKNDEILEHIDPVPQCSYLSDEFMQNLNNKHNTRKIEKKNARDKL